MKKLIFLFAILISTITFSQTYEGTATVSLISENYASIVFGSRGNSPSSFIVKLSELDPNRSKLEEHKKYYFVLKRVKFKGTKKTAEVLYYEKDRTEIFKELKTAKEKIKDVIITL